MGASTALFHTTTLALYLYVMYFLHKPDENKLNSKDVVVQTMAKFSGRFLTNWTFSIQAIYFLMCIVQYLLSIISANKMKDKLTKYSDYLFTAIATPMALMVSIIFWSIFLVDRELIFPKALDQFIPVWINHCIHTFNSALAIMDMYLVNHKFPSWGKAIQGTLGYLTIYGICIFGTYLHTGVWIYPFMKQLDWPQRILFTIITLLIGISMYALTKLLHRIIWGSTTIPEKPKKSSKTKKK